MVNSRTMKTKHLIQGFIAAGAALLVVSCHPNRPNVPATQTVWNGSSYNRTSSSGHNARLILNALSGVGIEAEHESLLGLLSVSGGHAEVLPLPGASTRLV